MTITSVIDIVECRDYFEPGGAQFLCKLMKSIVADVEPDRLAALLQSLGLARIASKSENNKCKTTAKSYCMLDVIIAIECLCLQVC